VDEESEDWYRSLLEVKDDKNILLVAVADGRPVGFVNSYYLGERGYVEAIAIHPDYRSMGIGSLLLAEAEARLLGRGVEVVKLNVKQGNLKALSFYLRHGYTIDGVTLIASMDLRGLKFGDEGLVVQVLRGDEREAFHRKMEAMPSTWWSTVTEKSDLKVYRRYSRELTVAVYVDGRFCGLADMEPERVTTIDYLAVSYNNFSESLKSLLRGLEAYLSGVGAEKVLVPVDSSRKAFLSTLINEGYRVVETEYRLSKRISSRHGS